MVLKVIFVIYVSYEVDLIFYFLWSYFVLVLFYSGLVLVISLMEGKNKSWLEFILSN